MTTSMIVAAASKSVAHAAFQASRVMAERRHIVFESALATRPGKRAGLVSHLRRTAHSGARRIRAMFCRFLGAQESLPRSICLLFSRSLQFSGRFGNSEATRSDRVIGRNPSLFGQLFGFRRRGEFKATRDEFIGSFVRQCRAKANVCADDSERNLRSFTRGAGCSVGANFLQLFGCFFFERLEEIGHSYNISFAFSRNAARSFRSKYQARPILITGISPLKAASRSDVYGMPISAAAFFAGRSLGSGLSCGFFTARIHIRLIRPIVNGGTA